MSRAAWHWQREIPGLRGVLHLQHSGEAEPQKHPTALASAGSACHTAQFTLGLAAWPD